MSIGQRWKRTALHNQLLVLVGGIAAAAAVISVIVTLIISRGEAPISQHSEGQLSPNIISNMSNITIYSDANGKPRSSLDFENVLTWSVSFKIGGLIAARPLVRLRHKFQKPSNDAAFERLRDWLFLPEIAAFAGGRLVCDAVVLDDEKNISTYVIGLPECRFYNLSATQRRLIDMKLMIPTRNPQFPPITLNTQSPDFLFKMPQRIGNIDVPMILEPSSRLEGRIDFIADR